LRVAQAEFRELVEAHQSRVYSIAYRILGDTGVAEEVAQDVFLELHRNLSRLDSAQHVLAWLRRVAVHRATDALRRRASRAEYAALEFREEASWLAAANPCSPGESALSTRVEQLVATLPPAQRSVLLLRYQEDLLPDEIAATLSMPVATVKSYLQRALQLLRAKAQSTLKEYTRDRA
jgi:RNA polymerase sigma-70 factor, ECF subfamily